MATIQNIASITNNPNTASIDNPSSFYNKMEKIKNYLYKKYYNPENLDMRYIIGLKFNRIPKSGYYFLNKLSDQNIFIKYEESNYAFINNLPPHKKIELDKKIKNFHHHFIISLELFDAYKQLVIDNINLLDLEGFWPRLEPITLILKYDINEILYYSQNSNNIINPPPGLDIYTCPKSDIPPPPGLSISHSSDLYTSRSVLTITEIVNDTLYKCNLCNSSYSENYYKVTTTMITKNVCNNCYKIINNIFIQKINY